MRNSQGERVRRIVTGASQYLQTSAARWIPVVFDRLFVDKIRDPDDDLGRVRFALMCDRFEPMGRPLRDGIQNKSSQNRFFNLYKLRGRHADSFKPTYQASASKAIFTRC